MAANSPLIGPDSISADHWIPLWGVGLGNDFGHLNESYFTATTGWRPTRFFDIAGTTRTIPFGEDIPEPFHSLDFELGVHGTPIKGLWYDVGLFWTQFDNRTENMNVAGSNTQFIVLNTGSSRSSRLRRRNLLRSPCALPARPRTGARTGSEVFAEKRRCLGPFRLHCS